MGQRSRNWLSLVCLAALASCQADDGGPTTKLPAAPGPSSDIDEAVGATPGAEILARGDDGVPTFIGGDLGRAPAEMDARLAEGAMRGSLETVAPMFRLRAENLRFVRAQSDELGYRHIRYQQQENGLDVVGGDLVLHVDSRGTVYAANGGARGFFLPATPRFAATSAVATIQHDARFAGTTLGEARLVYVISTRDLQAHLAWEIVATGEREGTPVRDRVYVDAHAGDIADVHPEILTAKSRAVYNTNHSTSLPGTLARSEGGAASTDTDVNVNYDHLGTVHDCYLTAFGRDSFDGAGAQLKSTVHYSNNYVNAFWNGTQMVYGDGDGVNASSLARSLDVTAHELTHAVTERTAGLIYSNESGALNEGMSDIFGAFCEEFKDGVVSARTWIVGDDVWTPATPGDGLRYMDNPTKDGSSKDYYPERYTGFQDNGGVHWNSGIANLAFYLLSQGGKHPRGKTTVEVPALGIDKAGKIFYRALTVYMNPNTNFAAAKTATISAATDLYGAESAEVAAVKQAWEAVGVGGEPPPDPGTVVLVKDAPVTLSGATGDQKFFKLAVPAGATNLKITTAGSDPDADLYVKFGARPTTQSNDAKSETETSNETVTIAAPQAGDYYILVYSYESYASVTLTGTYSGTTPPPPDPTSQTWPNLSGDARSWKYFTFDVPAGKAKAIFTIRPETGATGDADLYVRRGKDPTTTLYACRPYKNGNTETCTFNTPTAGTYHIGVRGYSAYTRVVAKAEVQ